MDPWEALAVRSIDSFAQLGLQFGAAYGQNWLAQDNAEARLELAQRYAARAPQAPSPMLLVLIVGLVVLAVAKD